MVAIKICPKCGSTNIVSEISPTSGSTGFFCEDCKYGENPKHSKMGNFFPEVEISDVEKFRKDLNNENKSQ